jgi:hypothetical protein
MPLQLLAIVWIVSTDEQVGEKLNSFRSLNKIEISKDNYIHSIVSIVWKVSTHETKLGKSSIIFETGNFFSNHSGRNPEKELRISGL